MPVSYKPALVLARPLVIIVIWPCVLVRAFVKVVIWLCIPSNVFMISFKELLMAVKSKNSPFALGTVFFFAAFVWFYLACKFLHHNAMKPSTAVT
jgi:hypothetical protein